MSLITESFVLTVDEQCGRPKLLVEAKRYTSPSLLPSGPGHTLLLTHGVSFHKELWEPTLSRLFELQSLSNHPVRICEAWTIDCPSHGASAPLNDYTFNIGYVATYRDYTRAVTAFLSSGLVDLDLHCIIGIGHSAGSAALVGAANEWLRSTGMIPFRSLVMLEPPMISAELDAKYNNFNASLAKKAQRRRSHWASREEAAQYLSQRQNFWDPRCLALFMKYGLRNTRANSRDMTLSCTVAQEAACYSVSEQVECLEVLSRLCPLLPIHTIFAEFVDLGPDPQIQLNVVDERQGRKMASITRMPGVGHFAPFQNPETTAHALFNCLYLSSGRSSVRSHSGRGGFLEARL